MRLPVNKTLYYLLHWLGFPVVWEVSVGAVLYRITASGDREYLLLQYPSGHFDFAKGHVESGESEIETLRRETEEETSLRNIEVLDTTRMSIRYFYIAKGSEREKRLKTRRGIWIFKEVHFYPACVAPGETLVLSDEHIGYVWLPYVAAVEKATFDNAKNLIVQTEQMFQVP